MVTMTPWSIEVSSHTEIAVISLDFSAPASPDGPLNRLTPLNDEDGKRFFTSKASMPITAA
jgi:hypothetical protein